MNRKSIYFLFLAVLILTTVGCVMLFSTATFAQQRQGDPNFYIKRQFMWIAAGFVAFVVTANLRYDLYRRWWRELFILSAIALTLCFVPQIGIEVKGARRWLGFGVVQFQPSELAKLASVTFLAWWFSRDKSDAAGIVDGVFIPLSGVAVLMALIVFEVDVGCTALLGATALAVMFVAGSRLRYLLPLCAIGVLGVVLVATQMPERYDRLMAFMNLEEHKLGAGLQQYQASIAFGSGGIEGLGLGEGRQKTYLPEAHTDFIFAMVGEEMGLRITLLVVFSYLVFVVSGFAIAMNARDRFGSLLGVGLVIVIALQAAINIGVVTAMLPNKGMSLPFISYGGSNLVFCLASVGILMNIYRYGLTEKEIRQRNPLPTRASQTCLAVKI